MNKKISYVEFERRILVNLVGKYRDTVENKKTDSSTVYKKQQIWLRITNEYNRHPNVRKRVTKQLKRLWENTKARAKKNTDTISITPNISSTSTSLALCNEIEETMETNSSASCVDVPGFDQIFDQTETGLMADLKDDHQDSRQKRRTDAGNGFLGEENYEQFLTPIVSARLKKVEESTEQQKELHNLQIQREQLQIKVLQEDIHRKSEQYAITLDRERELHDLRIKQEKDLHAQRIRNEQELHQLKLAEFNKVQAPSYPIMYK